MKFLTFIFVKFNQFLLSVFSSALNVNLPKHDAINSTVILLLVSIFMNIPGIFYVPEEMIIKLFGFSHAFIHLFVLDSSKIFWKK